MSDFKLIPLQHRLLDGNLMIFRGIPSRKCRKVGPWCFFDKINEPTINTMNHLNVGPHPHIGLQILSWFVAGSVAHQDSLGNKVIANEGDLNFMTAGRGIVHTEDSPASLLEEGNSMLHLLQFWIALPKADEEITPDFVTMKQRDLPIINFSLGQGKLIAGQYQNQRSPLKTYSPIFAMELTLMNGEIDLSLIPAFEYGITMIEGVAHFENAQNGISLHEDAVMPDNLLVFTGVESLRIKVAGNARFMIFGGSPLEEAHYIWWNYVSSDPDKIRHSQALWESGDTTTFPNISGEAREKLVAPELPAKFIAF